MSKFYDVLTPEVAEFIKRQPVFFTATAPEQGRINLSPKGMDAFRVFDERTVAYIDITGSGNETATHLRQNGRITVMQLRPRCPYRATVRKRPCGAPRQCAMG